MDRNITAVILIVLAIGVYVTLTSKIWDETKAIGVVSDQYVAAIENADRLIKVRDKVLTEYNAISAENLDRLNKMSPTVEDNIRLIIDLNSLAENQGVKLSNINVAGVGNTGNSDAAVKDSKSGRASVLSAVPVGVSFSLSATYDRFKEFMRALEANLRIMDVTELSLKVGNDDTYDYSVKLNTYWLKE